MARTRKNWMDLALFYCSKRETSRKQLERYLLRKLREEKPTEEEAVPARTLITEVLGELVRLRVVEDARYAGILTREYARRGKGRRYIEQKLGEKGLSEEAKKLETDPDEEFERALNLARKTLARSRISSLSDPREKKQKVLQKLVASGFELSVAKKALETALRVSD